VRPQRKKTELLVGGRESLRLGESGSSGKASRGKKRGKMGLRGKMSNGLTWRDIAGTGLSEGEEQCRIQAPSSTSTTEAGKRANIEEGREKKGEKQDSTRSRTYTKTRSGSGKLSKHSPIWEGGGIAKLKRKKKSQE